MASDTEAMNENGPYHRRPNRSRSFLRSLFNKTNSTEYLNEAKPRRSKSTVGEGSNHSPNLSAGTVQIRTIEITKRPGQNLGFYLRDGNGVDRCAGIFVSRLTDKSPLAKNQLIKAGDEILAVNSMPTSSMKIEDCVYIISLSSKLLITVRSLPSKSNHHNGFSKTRTKPVAVKGITSADISGDQTPKPVKCDKDAQVNLENGHKRAPMISNGSSDEENAPVSSSSADQQQQFATLPSKIGPKHDIPQQMSSSMVMEEQYQVQEPPFFGQRPQRYKSVEEFSYNERGCICQHQQLQQPQSQSTMFQPTNGIIKPMSYRGLVRPVQSQQSSLTNLSYDPSSNCYNCIRFGTNQCPNHSDLVTRRYPQGYYENSGYVSDSYATPRVPSKNQRGVFNRYQRPLMPSYGGSYGNLYQNSKLEVEQQQELLVEMHHLRNSTSVLQANMRRPNMLDISGRESSFNSSDDDDDDDGANEESSIEMLQRLAAKQNHRLQRLLMQQQEGKQQGQFPTFVDYKRLEAPRNNSFAEGFMSGLLNVNIQAYHVNADENKQGPVLSSIYCLVSVDGVQIGKTAARIGLKSFYFNEIFSVNLSKNRFISLDIFTYLGPSKTPQMKASVSYSLVELLTAENGNKVGVPTHPNGTIFLRWLLKNGSVKNDENHVEEQQIKGNENNRNDLPSPCFRGTANGPSVMTYERLSGAAPNAIAAEMAVVNSPSRGREIFGIALDELVEEEIQKGLLSSHCPILVQLCVK